MDVANLNLAEAEFEEVGKLGHGCALFLPRGCRAELLFADMTAHCMCSGAACP